MQLFQHVKGSLSSSRSILSLYDSFVRTTELRLSAISGHAFSDCGSSGLSRLFVALASAWRPSSVISCGRIHHLPVDPSTGFVQPFSTKAFQVLSETLGVIAGKDLEPRTNRTSASLCRQCILILQPPDRRGPHALVQHLLCSVLCELPRWPRRPSITTRRLVAAHAQYSLSSSSAISRMYS
jgi:hypothetical protein